MSLFDFDEVFGGEGFTSLMSAEKKEEPKKKAEAKKDAKKETKKSTKASKYNLPLRVFPGINSPFTLEGEGEKTEKEIKDMLYAYDNTFAPDIITLQPVSKGCRIKFRISKPGSLDGEYRIILNGFEIPVTFDKAAGVENEDEAEDGEDSTEEDKTTLVDTWVEQYPYFKGCEYTVSLEKKVIVPLLKENTEKEVVDLPYSVSFFGGEVYNLTSAEVAESADNAGKALITSVKAALLSKLDMSTECGIQIFSEGETHLIIAGKEYIQGNTPEVKETLYSTNCLISIYGDIEQLTPDLFGGKAEVTKKEILDYCVKTLKHIEFASEYADLLFDKSSNLLLPSIGVSGRKGVRSVTWQGGAEVKCETKSHEYLRRS